jgi:hypothetical protein
MRKLIPLDEVIDSGPRHAEKRRHAVDVDKALIATPLEQIGDTPCQYLELIRRERDHQRKRLRI